MKTINCNNYEEAVKEIRQAFELPEETVVLLKNKKVFSIKNNPDFICSIFYLASHVEPDEIYEPSERTQKALERVEATEDEFGQRIILHPDFIESLRITDVEVIRKISHGTNKERLTDFPKTELSVKDFMKFAKTLFNHNDMARRCTLDIKTPFGQFYTFFFEMPDKNKPFLLAKKMNIKDHIFYKACMKAVELCRYLLYLNVIDLYDDSPAEITSKKRCITENEEATKNGILAYECEHGICVEFFKKPGSSSVFQYILLDNEFTRENFHLLKLVDFNFLGLDVKAHPDMVNIIQSLNIDRETRRKLLRLRIDRFNTIRYLPCEKNNNGLLTFKIENLEVIKLEPGYKDLIQQIKSPSQRKENFIRKTGRKSAFLRT